MTSRDKPGERNGPVWSRIADDIAGSIERGEHRPGTVLPAAAEIAGRYGVNRHTVRQALLHLQGLGLLSVERGKGAAVVGARFPYRIGRRVSLRANFAKVGLDVTGTLQSCECRPATEEEAAPLAIEPGADVWSVMTVSRTAGLPVSAGRHILPVGTFPDLPAKLEAAKVSFTAAFRAYGIDDYVRLTTRLTADVATAEEAGMMEIAAGSPVMRTWAVDARLDRSPLQLIQGLFAGMRVDFVVELTD